MNEPTHLDLFSGIGGFALAAHWAGFRTVAFCEIDPYCQRVLAKNFGGAVTGRLTSESVKQYNTNREWLESLGSAVSNDPLNGRGSRRERRSDSSGARESEQTLPIHRDIFNLDGTKYRGCALLTGGFPCQPFSVAGKRRGAADDRHIWPEMLRVIAEARPAWVLGENVPGIIGMELDSLLSDLEAQGYATRTFVIPACGVDARHRRNRVWIVAHYAGARLQQRREMHSGSELARRNTARSSRSLLANSGGNGGRQDIARRQSEDGTFVRRNGEVISDSANRGQPVRRRASREGRHTLRRDLQTEERPGVTWLPEPDVGRVAHGIPARVDRLRGLGNAIVPQVAFEILKAIRAEIG